MSWDDIRQDRPQHPDPRTRLNALIAGADAEELRLILAIVERVHSLRPRPGSLDVPIERDGAGYVTMAAQAAIDATLAAAGVLLATRRQQT